MLKIKSENKVLTDEQTDGRTEGRLSADFTQRVQSMALQHTCTTPHILKWRRKKLSTYDIFKERSTTS